MAVKLSPIWVGTQFLNTAGNVLSGGKIYQYQAGTTTPLATYTDSTGATPNANPIILDSTGRYSAQIWFTAGSSYKLVLTDSSGVTQLTEDNLTAVNDGTSATPSEWVALGLTPTYISSISFSVPGNVTGILQVGRRIQATVTAGTVYGTIATSVYTSITTVTVTLDSGALDTGLSAIYYALLNATNPSVPPKFIVPVSATAFSGPTTGVTTGSAASAGQVGELLSNTTGILSGLTTLTPVSVASLTLTAGDWDVWGIVKVLPAGTTVVYGVQTGISTTAGSVADYTGCYIRPGAMSAGTGVQLPTVTIPFDVGSSTTVYFNVSVEFNISTCQAAAYIYARRRR